MKTLVFWGGGRAALARARADDGAALLLWDGRGEAALREAGVPFRRASDLLQDDDQDAIDEAAIAWTKAWGKRPLVEGRSFREAVQWKGLSLWWLAELYLHHSTRAPARVRVIETFRRLLERVGPDEVEAVGLSAEDALLLARTCSALRILCHGAPAR
ncbi:MAG TPA: hypothetical protein VFO85_08445, partial [Vicinamibacteria bacterium]|nr:hypothetical protein [Vicinamibacteria bacterium]